jgi:hypothetical protein
MHGAKGAALAKLVADKGKTKSKDEAKRAEVTTKIQGIFAATETDVKKILDGLDPKVEKEFERGEAAARSAFETYVSAKMSAYKEDRYGGWLGGLRWAKDKLVGMPDKVNEFFEAGRELYLKQMDVVISRVADIVSNDLTAAKKRIAAGKAEIASYVKSLPADLQKVGSEASKEIGEKFEQLENDVTAKQESVVDTLATKYVEARQGLDERIEALQAENKGLVDKAVGAIKAVINTIRELVAMLSNVLSRVAGVVGEIIKNPIGFLGNLIAGVKGGILKFKDNILDHLRKGLMGWLFGALAEGGIELPDKLDVKGIIKLLASLFGLTWANIRNRLVKQIGEKAMAAAEKGVEIFRIIAAEGVAGLWNMLSEKLGDIKEMILEQVKDFVITKIITAGITWLIGLLNPAAAFIKACKLIYDVVMFFVSNAGRILKFVNTVIDSVADIVRGNVSGVINKINDVLGQMVPIIIGFLASVIGLGGIGQKIRQIVETLQKPITKALDFVIKTGLTLAGPIIRGIKGISGKVKAKVAAGKAWVKGKAEAGKAWVAGKVRASSDAASNTPDRQRLAIAEADKALSVSSTHEEAARRTAALATQTGVPLKLVTESKEPDSEKVHVQTMSTGSHKFTTTGPYNAKKRTVEQLWGDTDPTNAYPGETSADVPNRVAAAKAQLTKKFANYKAEFMDALIAHKGGTEPRPFTSVAQEDSYGGHTTQKHIDGMGLMLNSKEALAMRVVRGLPGEGPVTAASYFMNIGEANASVDLAIKADWPTLRGKVAAGKGKVERPLAGAGPIGYSLMENPALPAMQVPTYLGGPYPGPLYHDDPKAHNPSLPPMTVPAIPVGALIVVKPDSGKPGGWYVRTSFPN